MSYVAVRWLSAGTTALAAMTLLASCAVGPDFVHPAAPEITRYTREPLAPQTSSADVAAGQRQRFIAGRDIPKEWWAVFKSPALNALIERSLANNPNLQSAMATLRAAQAGGLRARRQVLPAGAGQFQSDAQSDPGFAYAGAGVRRQHLQSLHRAAAGLLHVRCLGPQSARGGIAAGARRRATLRGRGRLSGADIERRGRGHHRGVAARRRSRRPIS